MLCNSRVCHVLHVVRAELVDTLMGAGMDADGCASVDLLLSPICKLVMDSIVSNVERNEKQPAIVPIVDHGHGRNRVHGDRSRHGGRL